MGLFDTVWTKNKAGEDVGIQFKSGDELLLNLKVGDETILWEGIHFGFEGCFVVLDNKIVAAFAKEDDLLFTKWGGEVEYPDLS